MTITFDVADDIKTFVACFLTVALFLWFIFRADK
jgi:hypothetical protein